MTFPAYDMVTFEDNMYHSRLYHLYKHDSWAPEPEQPQNLTRFPVCLSSCWQGYLTVFSAKLNENFEPSWILTFSPVEECPVLYGGGSIAPEIKPQPVPEFIDGAPVPQRGTFGFQSAYDISNIPSHFCLWELGLILWKNQKKYLLEIGRLDYKVNRVLGLKEMP